MTALGLRSSGRLGMSPRGRRPSSPPFSPDQISCLAIWYRAGDPQMATVGVDSARAPADQLRLIDWAVAKRASEP